MLISRSRVRRGEPGHIPPEATVGRSVDIEYGHLEPLERASREWRGTFDAIEWPIVLVDRAFRVRRLNHATLKIVGGTYASWIGAAASRLGPGEPWLAAMSLLDRLFTDGTPGGLQVEDPQTLQTWEVSVRTVETGRGPTEVAMVIIRDISRVTRLEQSLRHSETMAGMGSLLAGVAHEVRNPLFAISSILDAWTARGPAANLPAYQAVLRKEVDRLRNLMEELLEYGRPYTNDTRPGSIADVIAEASTACAALAERHQVNVRIDVPHATLLFDRDRMCRVFINLIQNAIQHAPPGTEVLVQAVGADANAPVQITVRDRGTGFAEEDIPNVFSPFFTRRTGGTGLGLAIVRRTIQEHRGTVGAENHPEGGAVVRLTLHSSMRVSPGGTTHAGEDAHTRSR